MNTLTCRQDGAPVFTSGTKLAAEFDELSPKQGEAVIVKNYPGSFTGTDLQEQLEKSGKKKVVLTGYMVGRTRSAKFNERARC